MKISGSFFLLLGVAGSTGMSALASPAFSQDHPTSAQSDGVGLAEVVVTARKRQENLQTTPISVTAVSRETLEARNFGSATDVAALAPNVATPRAATSVIGVVPMIRGIGQVESIMTQDPSVGVYIDGVYNARNNNVGFDLVELQRVEVLRGPQGTLFGRNNTGGAISFVTRDPADTLQFEQKIDYGTFNAISSRSRVDTGLIGTTGLKAILAYQHRLSDGVSDNTVQPDSRDPGSYDSDAFWGKVVGEWGHLKLSFTGDYDKLRGVPTLSQLRFANPNVLTYLANSPALGGAAFTPSPGYADHQAAAFVPRQNVVTRGVSFTAEYALAPSMTLKSISGWREFSIDAPIAVGPANLVGRIGSTPATAVVTALNGVFGNLYLHRAQRQISEEVQLVGALGDLDYVLGGYYFHENGDETSATQSLFVSSSGLTASLPVTPTRYDIANSSYAGFAQASWRPEVFERRLEATAGIRYTEDHKEVLQYAPISRPRTKALYNNTSVLASLSYKFTSDIMAYARYTTGYRSGGFNVRASGPVPFIFLPER
jgi:iron complex outermembrane receptor protein